MHIISRTENMCFARLFILANRRCFVNAKEQILHKPYKNMYHPNTHGLHNPV